MLDYWALLGALYICVELCVLVVAGVSLDDCRVAFRKWSLALGFDWRNGMEWKDLAIGLMSYVHGLMSLALG
jgi:hypothetical protein